MAQAHDLAAVQIQHPRQIKPTLAGRHVSDVRAPGLIGTGDFYIGQPVGRNRLVVMAVGRGDAKTFGRACPQTFFPHQALDSLVVTDQSFLAQRRRDAGAAVIFPVLLEEVFDLDHEDRSRAR